MTHKENFIRDTLAEHDQWRESAAGSNSA